jgi:hypothetical protein
MKPSVMKPSIGPLGTLTGALAVIIGLTGCASPDTAQPPSAMASMSQGDDRRNPWIYLTPNADLRRYTRFIVEPVEVYRYSERPSDRI